MAINFQKIKTLFCARKLTLFLSFLLLFSDHQLSAQAMPTLSDYRWKNRLILLFAPDLKHTSLRQQHELLRADQQGLDERDLLVFSVLPNQVINEETNTKKTESAAELRKRYHVSKEDFLIILIGKDGSEKLRSDTVVTRGELYARIDAMPMRREEMRRGN